MTAAPFVPRTPVSRHPVWRALCGRRFGGLAWIVLLAFGPVALAPGWLGEARPLPASLVVLALAFSGLFAGFVLGLRVSALWGMEAQRLVPGYHRRLSRRAVAIGLLLAFAPLALAAALHPPLRTPALLKAGVLMCMAQGGAGFLWGFFTPRRVHWVARVALIVGPILWFNLAPLLIFSADWAPPAGSPWAPYHPLTLLALLLAPWNWPWILARHRGAPLTRPDRVHALFTNRLVGTGLDLWLWQRLAPFLSLGGGARGAWLIMPTGAMSQMWVATVIALLVWAVQRLFGLPWPIFATTLYVGCVGAFGVTLPLRPGQIGRALLLPGGPRRARWPAWVGRQLFGALGTGIAVAWLPTLAAALLGGLGWGDALTLVLAVLATMAAAVAWQVFSLARRAGPAARPSAGVASMAITISVVLAASMCTLLHAPLPVRLATGALALAWVAGLLVVAQRRAPQCSFDA